MPYTDFPYPFRPAELIQTEVDDLAEIWGQIYLNGDKDQLEMIRRNGAKSGIVTFDDHRDAEDAFVDNTYDGANTSIFGTILEAKNSGGVAVLVKASGDFDALTIASGDSLQRLLGKDADTTIVPVDITCDKDAVTFEQLGFSSKTLKLSGHNNTARALLLSATAKLELDTGNTGQLIQGCRFGGITDSYALRLAAIGDSGISIANCRFVDGSSTNDIVKVTSAALGGLTIINTIFSHVNTQNSAYAVDLSSGTTDATTISNCQFISTGNGGLKINGSDNRITSCAFATGGAAGSNLSMSSLAGSDIDSVVSHCTFATVTSTDVLFECTSADADAAGLVLMGNSFRAGTILGSQDAVWIGNNMAACTIDFQSKTGIIVIGGDMTSATLQNIPADIVFRNVKGQDDRGDYLPLDSTVDLGADAKRFVDLWLSGNADIEGNMQLDGTLTIGSQNLATVTRTITLTAQGGTPTTTAGCAAAAQVEAGTNDVDYWVLDFDNAADEFAFWGPIAMPANYDGGVMNAIFYWTTTATGTTGVAWAIQLLSLDDNDAIDTAWGTAVVTTDDAQSAAGEMLVTAASGNITPGGTASAPETLFVRVFRDVSDGNDDMTEDARLIAVKLTYATNAVSD